MTNLEKKRLWHRNDYKRHKAAYIERSRKQQKTAKYKIMHKNIKMRTRYGITIEERDIMIKAQNGLCAICFINPATEIDHCHKSKVVRGILCQGCNIGIGFLKDDTNILFSAHEYLRQFGSRASNAPINKK